MEASKDNYQPTGYADHVQHEKAKAQESGNKRALKLFEEVEAGISASRFSMNALDYIEPGRSGKLAGTTVMGSYNRISGTTSLVDATMFDPSTARERVMGILNHEADHKDMDQAGSIDAIVSMAHALTGDSRMSMVLHEGCCREAQGDAYHGLRQKADTFARQYLGMTRSELATLTTANDGSYKVAERLKKSGHAEIHEGNVIILPKNKADNEPNIAIALAS